MKTKDTALEDFVRSIKPKRYQEATIKSYSECIYDLITYYKDIRPSKISQSQIKDFINKRIDDGISSSYQNVYINAINLWWSETYNRKRIHFNQLRPKNRKILQKVLSKESVLQGFMGIQNPKHKAICAMMYLCGMRIGEVINCKIQWFDKSKRELRITGKGAKDRIIPYSEELRIILSEYFKQSKPQEYLFTGQTRKKYSPSSIRKITHRFFNVNPHGLRHAFAVHLYKEGTDIYSIKRLLGHNDIRTTEIYIHLDSSDLAADIDKLSLSLAA